jgi:endonuclease/exonuclease/phosphatase family metal-dependent hydrolase
VEQSETSRLETEANRGWWSRLRKCVVVGAATLATTGIGIIGCQPFDKTGKTEGQTPSDPLPPEIDNTFNVASWNMQNKTDERLDDLESIITKHDIDVMALQEVSPDEVGELEDRFSQWYTAHVRADGRTKPIGGNHVNMLMSRQEIRNVSTVRIEGTDRIENTKGLFAGLGVDVAQAVTEADTSIDETKDRIQERRAFIAGTVQAGSGELRSDVRVVTGHISGFKSVRERQLSEGLSFIKENTKENRPTVFCGDLNASPDVVIPRFASLGAFIMHETENTSTDHKVIDYCAYDEGGVLGLGEVNVLKRYATDHRAMVAKWELEDSAD